jgi:hypothetical protein
VTKKKIEILHQACLVPSKELVSCRPSRDELVSVPEDGEVIVFFEHFCAVLVCPRATFSGNSWTIAIYSFTTLGRMRC